MESPPVTPRKSIALFNGKDLSNFYTWLKGHGREDPARVFSVVDQVDGAPAIRISGQHDGGLVTQEQYTNYILVAEYRWGLSRWAPRLARARNSGIFVHCQGEDGNRDLDFRAPWGRSIELQVMEGRTGELLLITGYDRGRPERLGPKLTLPVVKKGNKSNWSPNGVLTEFDRGAIGWLRQDFDWKDVRGFRNPDDVERPAGEWNRVEITCDGGAIVCVINGEKVNEGKDGTYQHGRLLFQSESNEIFFRRIELLPLAKKPNPR